MPKPRGLLNHVSIETASRQRICHRHRTGKDEKPILPGEKCLVIETPVMGAQSYCVAAASEILEQARRDLGALQEELSPGSLVAT